MTRHASHDYVPFGLWVYIMSDCVLFASLFAAYAVLHTETAGGPAAAALFDPHFVLIETLVLLTSSFTCGLAVLAAERKNVRGVWAALVATLLLGGAFLAMELTEFGNLIAAGNSPQASAFLSAFFTLVGTHGLHIFIGGLWMLALLMHVAIRGITKGTSRGILYFSLFWHFLDIVWICIFSLVYLFGSLSL
ncbi:MAG: putative cytochrome o ubiquinol oxidase chain cyoC [Parcubacteria group bacterium]|nr:putative cytochrome o ubiquinol oxidase chain cyoC [Parcubacteria group bacterium]